MIIKRHERHGRVAQAASVEMPFSISHLLGFVSGALVIRVEPAWTSLIPAGAIINLDTHSEPPALNCPQTAAHKWREISKCQSSAYTSTEQAVGVKSAWRGWGADVELDYCLRHSAPPPAPPCWNLVVGTTSSCPLSPWLHLIDSRWKWGSAVSNVAAGCSAACQAVHGGDASPSLSDPGISSSAADAPEADAAGSTPQHSRTPAWIRREFVINKRSFASS